MLVNHRFLYIGVFLVAIGGVLVAADLAGAEASTIVDALRLWPLAVVAIGLGIALRRTRFSFPGGMLAAAVPGLVFGGGFALVPRVAADCGTSGATSSVATEQGVFDGPARVSVTTGCGSLVVTAGDGAAWRFETDNTASPMPIINASARSLTIDAGGRIGLNRAGRERDAWRLTLPTSEIEDLSVEVNAGQGQVDLSEASVASLSATVNAGRLSIGLSAIHDVVGSIEVNAGAVQLCAPSDLGLRVHQGGAVDGISINGRHQGGNDWESPNYRSATQHADLIVDLNLGDLEINSIGGCK